MRESDSMPPKRNSRGGSQNSGRKKKKRQEWKIPVGFESNIGVLPEPLSDLVDKSVEQFLRCSFEVPPEGGNGRRPGITKALVSLWHGQGLRRDPKTKKVDPVLWRHLQQIRRPLIVRMAALAAAPDEVLVTAFCTISGPVAKTLSWCLEGFSVSNRTLRPDQARVLMRHTQKLLPTQVLAVQAYVEQRVAHRDGEAYVVEKNAEYKASFPSLDREWSEDENSAVNDVILGVRALHIPSLLRDTLGLAGRSKENTRMMVEATSRDTIQALELGSRVLEECCKRNPRIGDLLRMHDRARAGQAVEAVPLDLADDEEEWGLGAAGGGGSGGGGGNEGSGDLSRIREVTGENSEAEEEEGEEEEEEEEEEERPTSPDDIIEARAEVVRIAGQVLEDRRKPMSFRNLKHHLKAELSTDTFATALEALPDDAPERRRGVDPSRVKLRALLHNAVVGAGRIWCDRDRVSLLGVDEDPVVAPFSAASGPQASAAARDKPEQDGGGPPKVRGKGKLDAQTAKRRILEKRTFREYVWTSLPLAHVILRAVELLRESHPVAGSLPLISLREELQQDLGQEALDTALGGSGLLETLRSKTNGAGDIVRVERDRHLAAEAINMIHHDVLLGEAPDAVVTLLAEGVARAVLRASVTVFHAAWHAEQNRQGTDLLLQAAKGDNNNPIVSILPSELTSVLVRLVGSDAVTQVARVGPPALGWALDDADGNPASGAGGPPPNPPLDPVAMARLRSIPDIDEEGSGVDAGQDTWRGEDVVRGVVNFILGVFPSMLQLVPAASEDDEDLLQLTERGHEILLEKMRRGHHRSDSLASTEGEEGDVPLVAREPSGSQALRQLEALPPPPLSMVRQTSTSENALREAIEDVLTHHPHHWLPLSSLWERLRQRESRGELRLQRALRFFVEEEQRKVSETRSGADVDTNGATESWFWEERKQNGGGGDEDEDEDEADPAMAELRDNSLASLSRFLRVRCSQQVRLDEGGNVGLFDAEPVPPSPLQSLPRIASSGGESEGLRSPMAEGYAPFSYFNSPMDLRRVVSVPYDGLWPSHGDISPPPKTEPWQEHVPLPVSTGPLGAEPAVVVGPPIPSEAPTRTMPFGPEPAFAPSFPFSNFPGMGPVGMSPFAPQMSPVGLGFNLSPYSPQEPLRNEFDEPMPVLSPFRSLASQLREFRDLFPDVFHGWATASHWHAGEPCDARPTLPTPAPLRSVSLGSVEGLSESNIGRGAAGATPERQVEWGEPCKRLAETRYCELKLLNPTQTQRLKDELPKVAAAFLNYSGGSVYFGVKDDCRPIGFVLDNFQRDAVVREIDVAIRRYMRPASSHITTLYRVEFIAVVPPKESKSEIARNHWAEQRHLTWPGPERSEWLRRCIVAVHFLPSNPLSELGFYVEKRKGGKPGYYERHNGSTELLSAEAESQFFRDRLRRAQEAFKKQSERWRTQQNVLSPIMAALNQLQLQMQRLSTPMRYPMMAPTPASMGWAGGMPRTFFGEAGWFGGGRSLSGERTSAPPAAAGAGALP